MESGKIARFVIRYGQLPATAFARHTSKVANMFVVIGIGGLVLRRLDSFESLSACLVILFK
jgi:hypothetical protein